MAMRIKGGKRLIYIVASTLLIFAAVKFAHVSQKANANAAETAQQETTAPSPKIDVVAALASRMMGDEKAPVTIDEYASLSCSHCAHFNKETFEALKTKYIDTGKVRFIYHDFPTSGSALEAAMAARCLPQERYFQFIKFLFETQDQWAFSPDYRSKLKQNAGLLGLGGEVFDACIASEKLKAGLVEVMESASKTHEIKSTPTFIINGKEKINGAQPLSAFEKVIDPLLEAR